MYSIFIMLTIERPALLSDYERLRHSEWWRILKIFLFISKWEGQNVITLSICNLIFNSSSFIQSGPTGITNCIMSRMSREWCCSISVTPWRTVVSGWEHSGWAVVLSPAPRTSSRRQLRARTRPWWRTWRPPPAWSSPYRTSMVSHQNETFFSIKNIYFT